MILKLLNRLREQQPHADTEKDDTAESKQNDDISAVTAADEEHTIAATIERQIDETKIDVNALWVVSRLKAKGFDAYLTGGCIRDLLRGGVPKDFDVATSAKPEEVRKIFRNCRLIGRRFLLAHVFFPEGKVIETSTFRANPVDVLEDMPEDLLVRQDNVFGTIEDDAKRRDLTINGLFYDPVAKKVIDFVDGLKDLDAGLVRTIGNPDIRFREDPVRILRAIKFASRLGFELEEKTRAAMKDHAKELSRCAPSRVQEEIVKIITCGHAAKAVELCREIGVFDILLPELIEGLESEYAPKAGDQVAQKMAVTERNELFKAMLQSLDEVVSRECEISSAVAFSAIILPTYLALEESDQNERQWLDKLCVTWSERIRLTRRDQDHMRLLLSAVLLLEKSDTVDRSVHYLVRKPWFREVLLLYILLCESKKVGLEKVTALKSIAAGVSRSYMQDRRGTVVRQPVRFRRPRPLRSKSRRSAV